MSGEAIEVTTKDGVADAYLARPEDGAPRGGLLLMVDAFGLRAQIERMAERMASWGFVVLAPNVFYRSGRAPLFDLVGLDDPAHRAPLLERIRPLMQTLTPEVIVRDGGAYLDALERQVPGPVGVTGYCMGARLAWRIAAAYPERVAALGGFHAGGLVTDDADSPHRSAGRLRAEAYFGHADNDRSMTPEQMAELDRTMQEAGVRHRAELYAGAAHGYTMADAAAYDEAAAERHYRELRALLERTIAAGR